MECTQELSKSGIRNLRDTHGRNGSSSCLLFYLVLDQNLAFLCIFCRSIFSSLIWYRKNSRLGGNPINAPTQAIGCPQTMHVGSLLKLMCILNGLLLPCRMVASPWRIRQLKRYPSPEVRSGLAEIVKPSISPIRYKKNRADLDVHGHELETPESNAKHRIIILPLYPTIMNRSNYPSPWYSDQVPITCAPSMKMDPSVLSVQKEIVYRD